jgi:hypothetical protein
MRHAKLVVPLLCAIMAGCMGNEESGSREWKPKVDASAPMTFKRLTWAMIPHSTGIHRIALLAR